MRSRAFKPSALPQKLKPLSLGLESVQKILTMGFLVEIAVDLWTGRELHLSGMTCVFLPFTSLPPDDLDCVSLPFLLHFQHLLCTVSVLLSLRGPFLLGSQGLCSQSDPIGSILLFLLPQSTDPFQEIRLWCSGMTWRRGMCVFGKGAG